MPRPLLPLFLAAVVAAPAATQADVTLPAVFGDHMVLQSDRPLPVWGTAEPGEAVEVRVSVTLRKANAVAATAAATEQAQRATADADGNWRVTLGPLPATNEAIGFVVTGKNKLTLEDVIVGDVWVCSGQSNMEWPLAQANDAEAEIAAANHPGLRLFQVAKALAPEAPAESVKAQWVVCTPETVAGFSAVGYFFGRDIREATGAPVGLIGTYWGGTPAEAWTSRPSLEADATFQPILDRWTALDEKVAAGNAPVNQGPGNPHHPATLYNAMIHPLLPFAIKGAIWYQGESNAGRAYQYRTLFPAMISDWRAAWGQGDFPFFWVQLANFRDRKDQPADSDWAELREAQDMTLALPNTGQAIIIDIGEAKDIHPRNKQDVGHRLALAARHVAYGEALAFSGPRLKDAKFADGKAMLTLDHADGLTADGGAPVGFTLAGEDRVFHTADATIGEAGTITLSSAQVPQPTAARYAWADNPAATLTNATGLPAAPFRTDNWPGVTEKNN